MKNYIWVLCLPLMVGCASQEQVDYLQQEVNTLHAQNEQMRKDVATLAAYGMAQTFVVEQLAKQQVRVILPSK